MDLSLSGQSRHTEGRNHATHSGRDTWVDALVASPRCPLLNPCSHSLLPMSAFGQFTAGTLSRVSSARCGVAPRPLLVSFHRRATQSGISFLVFDRARNLTPDLPLSSLAVRHEPPCGCSLLVPRAARLWRASVSDRPEQFSINRLRFVGPKQARIDRLRYRRLRSPATGFLRRLTAPMTDAGTHPGTRKLLPSASFAM
jgi:hypothetical protein